MQRDRDVLEVEGTPKVSDRIGPIKNPSTTSKGLTRRSFLKTSALAAGAAAVLSSVGCGSIRAGVQDLTSGETQVFSSSCKASCMGGCRLKVEVRDEKIVRITAGDPPDPRYKGICLKGIANIQRTYGPERLKYPMRRAGERGEGKWEQISWDEAVSTITETWKKHQSEFGDNSVFMVGPGAIGCVGNNMQSRLVSKMNTSTIPYTTDMANIGYTGKILGVGPFYGGNEIADVLNARCLIQWGVNPSEAEIQQYHWFTEAQRNGTKIISINPNCSYSTNRADLHVPIRIGTDAALALSMINVIVRENWIDEEFLLKRTVAPILVKESDGRFMRMSDLGVAPEEGPVNASTGRPTLIDPLVVWDASAGTAAHIDQVDDPALEGTFTVSGITVSTAYSLLLDEVAQYTPAKAAEICQVSEELIEKTAEMYAKNAPASIFTMYGLDHYTNGHYGYWAIMTLAAVTGNVGRPGSSSGLALIGLAGMFRTSLGERSEKPGPSVYMNEIAKVFETGDYLGVKVTPKSLYVIGNAYHNVPDWQKIQKDLGNFEFIVVQDTRINDTALLADIVLPASFYFEYTELHSMWTPFAYYNEQIIEPLYESKPDFEIAKLFGTAMGFDGFDVEPDDIIQACFKNNAMADATGITYEELKAAKGLRCYPTGKNGAFVYGEEGRFGTASGRIEFYQDNPQPNVNYGQKIDLAKERLPHFEPPNEAWEESPLFEKYPLKCFNEHAKWRVHSGWGHAPWLRELDPEPVIKMNPKDAGDRGIKTGDTVKVFNDRGHVVLKARINNGLRPGSVNIPHGWEKMYFIEGHYQDLTSQVSNLMCVNNAFSDVLCEVEKI